MRQLLFIIINHLYTAASLVRTSPTINTLTLIGTHNSLAYSKVLRYTTARCQNHPVQIQLDKGVRVFDLRFRPPTKTSDVLMGFHGPLPLFINAITVYQILDQFLTQNPEEFIITLVRPEYTRITEADGINFSRLLQLNLRNSLKDINRLYGYGRNEPCLKPPTVDQVKGNIMLITRDFSIDWASAYSFGSFEVQDAYDLPTREQKQSFIRSHYERSLQSADNETWYVNFLSMAIVQVPPSKLASPLANSIVLNAFFMSLLIEKPPSHGFGIVMIDFPSDDILRLLQPSRCSDGAHEEINSNLNHGMGFTMQITN